MRTDKNSGKLDDSSPAEVSEEASAGNLNWLLDMDMSEPEERLFTVDQAGQVDTELTDYELEVARRPMTRGAIGADDLETYIDEEIVISSETQGGDIYESTPALSSAGKKSREQSVAEPMAIDYSRQAGQPSAGTGEVVSEGADILGLAEEDDIGEKYFVIKRVKPVQQSVEVEPQAPVCETTEAVDKSCDTTAQDEVIQADGVEPQVPVIEMIEQEPPASPVVLSDAPVLRLVNPGSPLDVANDEADSDNGAADLAASAEDAGVAASMSADSQGVLGYIASVAPPSDDQAFDNYLLNGKQLDDVEADINELTLEPIAGEAGYDADPVEAIDYHEDFHRLSAMSGQNAASLAQLIPQLMEELSGVLEARLAELGLAAGSVQPELVLGGDVGAAERLGSEGYEPAIAICTSAMTSLQQLRQAEVDTLYMRLVDEQSGQLCNRLFDEDFVLPWAPVNELDFAEESQLGTVSAGDELNGWLSDPASFAEEIPFTDELDHLAGGELQPEDSQLADLPADAEPLEYVAKEPDSTSDELVAVEPEGEQVDDFSIFAEDIFAQELNEDVAEAGSEPQADIEALFESLGFAEAEADEICGLDVEEFSAAAGKLQLVTESDEPAEVVAPESVTASEFSCIPAGITFSHASPGGGEIFSDFLDAFVEEGSSELEKLEDAVAAWERDVASDSAYAVVSRILHTIKGIAKGVGLHFYGTLIHNFETLLTALPRPQTGAEGDYFRIVNAWLDACVRGLDHIQDARADILHELPQPAGQGVAQEPETSEQSEPAREPEVAAAANVVELPKHEPAAVAPTVASPTDAKARQLAKKIADDGAKVLAAQQSVRITSEKLDHLLNLSNQAQQLSVRTAQSVTRGKRASTEMQSRLASVRAHISAIADRALRSVAAQGVQPGAPMDALEMDQYSELQEAANILREGVEDLADLVDFATRQNTQVEALLKQQTKVISSIGSSIRGARVVPVSRLIPGLRRLVRTVSADLNKTVSFQVLNELGTLDRDDYARCQTILDHMVRNALDHGIEKAEERLAAGKPAEGQVTIDIRKAGADSIITLSDDGRGIDPEKMRESALSKGLDVDVDTLSDAEAARLIFHKGFSTASSISQISGRGVGMDIVLSELQEMGGDIQIDSVPGRGTSFHIRVPSSVTVNGALLVSAGEQSYAIPLGGLIAVEQVPVDDFFAAVENNTPLSFGGMDCEPAYLATLCQNGHALDAKTWRTDVPVIIAGSPERYMAIAIDDVEEALELVIRSLGPQFSSVQGVAGAATTAAGEAIVALDLNLLVASVGAGDFSTLQLESRRDESLLVMVVDDSRTQRMVATSQLETVGVETITAENGAVAIDLLNAADRLPDIILMDVEMPAKDGIQALREIRKSVRYSHVPVIMITSRTGLKHRAMAQAAGCNGYMGKPFNFRMLIGQINELTGHRLQLS